VKIPRFGNPFSLGNLWLSGYYGGLLMQKKIMFKALSIFVLALFVISLSGAAATAASRGKVVEVTKLDQINKALKKGPVFLRVGTMHCPHCRALEPTLKQLAKEYTGKATIMSINIDKSPKLTKYFGVRGVPDCSVIVGTKNGKYVYMKQNGKTTTVRSQARIIDDRKINVYEKVLNYAI
jgi:thiol-disulfide isomerase/thioredoxin